MRELGGSDFSDGGRMPSRTASVALTSAGTPAAALRCPMFDLTEPMSSGRARPGPYARVQASTSVRSPSAVPVPWHST